MTPKEAENILNADREINIPSTMANVDPSLADLAETAAQRSGASAREIEEKLGKQKSGSRSRVYGKLKKDINPKEYYEEEYNLANDLRRRASNLYGKAYEFGEIDDPRIMKILNESKSFRKFYDRAKDISENDKLAAELRGEDEALNGEEKEL